MEMGRLPALPSNCVPVWQDWPEAEFAKSSIAQNQIIKNPLFETISG
jgi:hypothetical protein